MMKDEVLNYGGQLNTRCAMCEKFRHSIVDCPYIHLKLRRENVIHQHIRSSPNDRAKHDRLRASKQNTFSVVIKTRSILRKFRKQTIANLAKDHSKEDSNAATAAATIDENKSGGYHINIKPLSASERQLHNSDRSILTETTRELKRLSDKRFFLSTPRLIFDDHN